MPTFEIYNRESGFHLGYYSGATAEDAYRAMMDDADAGDLYDADRRTADAAGVKLLDYVRGEHGIRVLPVVEDAP